MGFDLIMPKRLLEVTRPLFKQIEYTRRSQWSASHVARRTHINKVCSISSQEYDLVPELDNLFCPIIELHSNDSQAGECCRNAVKLQYFPKATNDEFIGLSFRAISAKEHDSSVKMSKGIDSYFTTFSLEV